MLYVWSILAKKCSLRLKIEVFSGSGLVPTVFHFPTILHLFAYFSRVKTAIDFLALLQHCALETTDVYINWTSDAIGHGRIYKLD